MAIETFVGLARVAIGSMWIPFGEGSGVELDVELLLS